MYGDWSWLDPFLGYSRFGRNRVLFSHYMYRALPTTWMGGDGSTYGWPDPAGQLVRVLYIKPDREVFPGEPIFKTQKQLGGRSIATDCWGRSAIHQCDANPNSPEAGEGYWGHKEGYNVLYGDWHAKWYGDPQQSLIWWPIKNYRGGVETAGTISASYRYHIAGNMLGDIRAYWSHPSFLRDVNSISQGPGYIFHLFDVDAGIDVGADENLTF